MSAGFLWAVLGLSLRVPVLLQSRTMLERHCPALAFSWMFQVWWFYCPDSQTAVGLKAGEVWSLKDAGICSLRKEILYGLKRMLTYSRYIILVYFTILLSSDINRCVITCIVMVSTLCRLNLNIGIAFGNPTIYYWFGLRMGQLSRIVWVYCWHSVQEASNCSKKQALWCKVLADKNMYTFWRLGVFVWKSSDSTLHGLLEATHHKT